MECRDIRAFTIVVLMLTLAACTSGIRLRNPQTGDTASCGPYMLEGLGQPASVGERESRCLDDFRRQGFVRVPD
jgi:hypothetical protein